MTDADAIEAARHRVAEAREKVERQRRRFALKAVGGEAAAKSAEAQAAKSHLLELEAELEACEDALRKLETEV